MATNRSYINPFASSDFEIDSYGLKKEIKMNHECLVSRVLIKELKFTTRTLCHLSVMSVWKRQPERERERETRDGKKRKLFVRYTVTKDEVYNRSSVPTHL